MPPFLSNDRLAWVSGTALVGMIITGLVLSHQAAQQQSSDYTAVSSNIFGSKGSLPPLFPLQHHEYVGFAIAIVGLAVAAAGGIGGGGILLPVYTLIMRFPVKRAIPLTAVTVLGGSLANNFVNAPKRHPLHPSRPCIDWDVILMLEPMTMLGALAGAMLNRYLPAVVLVVMLLALLSMTSYLTLLKAKKLYDKETQAKRATNNVQQEATRQQEQQRLVASGGAVGYGAASASAADKSLNRQNTLNAAENTRQLWVNAAKLLTLFVVITVINLFKGDLEGTSADDSSLSTMLQFPACGTTCFWTANVVILALIVGFVLSMRATLLQRLDAGGPAASDISWDKQNTLQYPLYAIVAGLVAGLFGIGGGMVKGPLLLALGVHPQVASATSACMIFFTSSTATVSFAIFGLLAKDYAIACLLMGFVSALVGQSAISILMQRYQRHSYIAYSIGIVIAVSAVCMTAESVMALRANS